ncbi:MAG: hypothetical protein IKW59_03145 [Clostridia bacterium]|nr:hypothetical protein [Clostridia bacterium]
MPTFYNQATLSYNGNVTNSNIVTGELVDVLSATKTAISENYRPDDVVTYAISIVNSGATAFTGLTVSDDLGAYEFGTSTLVPLEYIVGSVSYFIDGVPQADPAVVAGPPLVFSGITVPAGGNALIIYQARANEFAPAGEDGTITNTATISGGGLSSPIVVEETISSNGDALLTITKSLSPESVAENGTLTYTFVIQNTGNTPIVATDNAIVTDTFNPILNPITVTFNDALWTEPANYTYNTATGEFATNPGQITVPAATYEQNPATGVWEVTPGVSVLRVTGTV